MKKPRVSTTRTTQGLLRACAMFPPQPFMAGTHSDLPLQLSVSDLLFQFPHPLALGVEHRDLVLDLDEGQPRHAVTKELSQDGLELFDDHVERGGPLGEMRRRVLGRQVMHEHESGGELRVLLLREAKDLPEGADELLAAGARKLVDGALGPAPFLL